MHRLRKNKKGKGDDDVPPVPEISTNKPFKKGKKGTPPPETPTLDLENALPASDDFRTSLLMPNLANRFSILKMQEQAAAAAKAENGEDTAGLDGSGGEGHGPRFMGLGDIDETSSLHGSTTSGYDKHRLTSKSDERRDSAEGSVMSRSRGGDGNMLFGGRQKVYRVPASRALRGGTSSMEDLRSESPLGTRTAYDPDLSPANFSRRKPKREQDQSADEIEHEPSDYNINRNTTSSTSSATPTSFTRSSTAATSVHSQGPYASSITASSSTPAIPSSPTTSMTPNKPRRPLYEQGLDQQLQDQQNTAIGRLEKIASLTRGGATSPPLANIPTRSIPGRISQPLTAPTSPISRQPPWPTVRPASPLLTPDDENKSLAGESKEAKAKPPGVNLGFDFGLEPRSMAPISPPISSSAAEFPTQGPFTPGMLAEDRNRLTPERGGTPVSPLSATRPSTAASSVSSLNDRTSERPTTADIRDAGATFFTMSATSSDAGNDNLDDRDSVIEQIQKQLDETHDESDSDIEEEEEDPDHKREAGMPLMDSPTFGPVHTHRMSGSEFSQGELSPTQPLKNPSLSPTSPKFSDGHDSDDDSPTLPPGQGLSVLVRQHLRSDSAASSMYAGSSYTRMSRMSRLSRFGMNDPKLASIYGIPHAGVTPSGASGSSAGNIWEFENFDGESRRGDRDEFSSPKSVRSSSSNADRTPATPPQPKDGVPVADSPILSAMNYQDDKKRDYDSEVDRVNGTGDSDDQDWEQQLAFRRRMIQQNIRIQEKINSQHEMAFDYTEEPPPPTKSNGFGGALSALKTKSSNGFLRGEKGDGGPKTGLVPRPASRARTHGDSKEAKEEEKRLRQAVKGVHHLPPHPAHQLPHGRPIGHTMSQFRAQTPPIGHPSESFSPSTFSPTSAPSSGNNSPKMASRMRKKVSKEQMNGGALGSETSLPGKPMGWHDPFGGSPRASPKPESPRRAKTDRSSTRPQPKMNGYRDDLSRAMMTGQSMAAEENSIAARRGRLQSSPDIFGAGPVKSSFDDDAPSGSFRKSRGNSVVGRTKGGVEVPPLPLLNTGIASSARPVPRVSTPQLNDESSSSSASSIKNPEALVKTIQSTNALFQPAKKRSVSKRQIGEPKLLSSTSSVPTIELPAQPSPTLLTPITTGSSSSKSRLRTNTIFASLSKSKSSEAVPSLPSSPSINSDEGSEKGFFPRSKLRKSTSDSGGLSARARADDIAAHTQTMPKLTIGNPQLVQTVPPGAF